MKIIWARSARPCSVSLPTHGLTYEQFLDDVRTQDAVMRNLQVIGEAVKRLSSSLRRAHSELPWREMAGTRDKIVHDYFGIRHHVTWTVASQEVPTLLPRIEALMTQQEDRVDEAGTDA